MSRILNEWKNRIAVIATMHGKEKVVSPILQSQLGISTFIPKGFDTDKFGMFTREVKRAGDQKAAARAKARAAAEYTGHDLVISSEGSFSPDPRIPYISRNVELVLLLDIKHSLEIWGQFQTNQSIVRATYVSSVEEMLKLATVWGFPTQGIIVRIHPNVPFYIHKECTTLAELEFHANQLFKKCFVKKVYIETDVRAHRCPVRMAGIAKATENLVEQCLNVCPRCKTPGFSVSKTINGLPCGNCNQPTELISEVVYSCQSCNYNVSEQGTEHKYADPGQCSYCNP